jgi:site-specific recombinase XerD
VQRFLDEIITVRKLAWATVNVYFSAYRFLYEQVLQRSSCEFSIPPRGRSGTRPGVLSQEEVRRIIAAPRNIKHRALLGMTYGSGLRVSEAVRVRLADVDRGRMMLRVEQGKGRKDRYTVLSGCALGLLEELWRAKRPTEFFFTGQDGIRPICVGTAQTIYYTALELSGVRRVGGIHVLRHCFATHLMETGVDIYTVKRWMGHTALVTTGRYMHVTAEHLAKVKSPLDTLYAKA